MHRPSLLCPTDLSEPSLAALAYAGAVADHFGARLTVLTVEDPLLAHAAAAAGLVPSLTDQAEEELRRACRETFGETVTGSKRVELRVRTGKAAEEILLEAHEAATDLIVMSSQGQTGARKMFFGSTTERVLRDTTVPVLVTPPERPVSGSFTDLAHHLTRVVTPVDLTAASERQTSVAAAIAGALAIPLLIAHVLEPIAIPARVRMALAGVDTDRRARAEDSLNELKSAISSPRPIETLVLSGDPADEIAKLTQTLGGNLIVMGLHSSERRGRRMGSVTYRILSSTRTLVLALPPEPTPSADAHLAGPHPGG